MTNVISFPNLGLEFTVNRAAFSVFGIDIYWYGLIITAGLLLAFWYALAETKRVGVKQDDLLNMFLIAVPVALICARLYYVIFSWDDYKDDLWQVFAIRGGGLAIYGGVIGAAVVVFAYCARKKLRVGKVLDILAVGLLIGQAIGRWGNFVNGEAFGTTTSLPWAMSITRDGTAVANQVHPTFLYESLWNAVGLGLLLLYKRVRKFDGELFLAYLAWYGLGRVWIEGLRTDSLYIGPIRVSQLLAGVSIVIGVGGILYRRRKAR